MPAVQHSACHTTRLHKGLGATSHCLGKAVSSSQRPDFTSIPWAQLPEPSISIVQVHGGLEAEFVCPAALPRFFFFQCLEVFVPLLSYYECPCWVIVISFIFIALSPKLMRNVYPQA